MVIETKVKMPQDELDDGPKPFYHYLEPLPILFDEKRFPYLVVKDLNGVHLINI